MANIPNIRFKGFADDWEQRKFGDLADYKKGPFGSALKKDIFVPRDETTVKVYEQQNAINKDWTLERYFVTEEYAQKLSGFKVGGGDIIVSCAGTIGETYELPTDAEPGIINQALMKIKVDESIIDKKMFIILFTNMIDDFTRVHSNGSAIKNIPPFSDLKPMEVLVPEIDEQKKISEYFSNLDNLITLHQRKCDEVRQLKKFMLQKMFPKSGELIPEIRFAGFTDAWEQRKLGELVQFFKGAGYSKADLKEAGTPIILYGRLYTKYETVITEIDTYADEKAGSVYSRGGEVIVPASGETAEDISIASVVEKSGVLLGGDLNIITPSSILDPTFLAISISNGKPHSDMAKMAQGKSVVHLHNSDLEKINLNYPCFKEQTQISTFFRDIDILITLHQRKCDKLKEVKRFMLQNMFPQKG